MSKKCVVKLKSVERKTLRELTRSGSEKARKLRRCQILLLSEEGNIRKIFSEAIAAAHRRGAELSQDQGPETSDQKPRQK